MYQFLVIILPADGPAPLDAWWHNSDPFLHGTGSWKSNYRSIPRTGPLRCVFVNQNRNKILCVTHFRYDCPLFLGHYRCVSDNIVVISKIFKNEMVIPEFEEFTEHIREIYESCKSNDRGAVSIWEEGGVGVGVWGAERKFTNKQINKWINELIYRIIDWLVEWMNDWLTDYLGKVKGQRHENNFPEISTSRLSMIFGSDLMSAYRTPFLTHAFHIMTSWHGNATHMSGSLGRESTGRRWIPSQKASDAELWCY